MKLASHSIALSFLLLAACGGGSSNSHNSQTNVSGRWVGSVTGSFCGSSGTITMNFNQSGDNLSGNLTASCSGTFGNNTFSGTINGTTINLTDNDSDTYNLTVSSASNISGVIIADGTTLQLNVNR